MKVKRSAACVFSYFRQAVTGLRPFVKVILMTTRRCQRIERLTAALTVERVIAHGAASSGS